MLRWPLESTYVSTAKPEEQIDLSVINQSLIEIEKEIVNSTKEHNKYLKELGLPPLPLG
jgi:type I restriction enzyme M protein